MRNYQLVLLLKSDLKKDLKDKLFEDIKKFLGKLENEKIDSLGEKKLSYPIKKERKGEYVVINFDSEKIDTDLNRRILIKDEILRHLLIRTN